ncbi:actin-histidine N-methyltransferase [Anabrus simplex]|uniref:actin-histidine N-methyltransferase n=1 Tax=Anabrus simplex TaxID=316456 RepID=UPI0035A3CA4C
MGKKNHGKVCGRGKLPVKDSNLQNSTPRKLSRQKRNEVNQIVEKLLKASTNIVSSPNVSKEWETYLEIQKLLEKVIQAESDMKVPLTDRSSHLEQFMSWMRQHGAEINGIKIGQFPAYEYGLQAEKDLEEGELMIAVPRKLMLTTETIADSVLGPLLRKDAMLQHMPNVALSLLLLVEKFSPSSFWKPYLAILPQEYTTVLYFKTHELQELKGSPSLEPALKQCRSIARQYAYFNKLFQTSADPASDLLRDVFSYEQYCWAVSTVMTRQNFVPSSDGNSMLNALIPLWDMANHINGKLTTDFNVSQQRSECMAVRPFRAGEQVFIFYGPRTNSELLVHNGFVYPDNKHDALPIRLGVSRADPLQPLRAKLLARLGLPTTGDFLLKSGTDPVDGRLLAFLRIFSMGQEHLEHWLESERASDLVYIDCALETEVETRTWTFLQTRIKLLLSAYPTTLEVDKELLTSTSVASPCQRLAIQMRISEKLIFKRALEYVEQHVRP